ncbi:MAG: Gfo/Idh/MocA family oxidoreductase [Bryobacteraceae bacterium]|nr:Gfo/Idh/MocA family oxidoreductase [Bryobacteraceae bacterium]
MTRRKLFFAAASYARILGANDRLGMALIGSGRRGREVMKAFLATGRSELLAVADVFDEQRARSREVLGKPALECVPHEEAMGKPGVDAVLIGAPDHWHLRMAQDAFRAGKHVYLEKPAIHSPNEVASLVDAAKASGKVCQVGTQQRSGAHYRRAKEEIFGKRVLGDITHVRATWSNFPWQARRIAPRPQPAGLDWERFVGPAPRRAYDWARYDSWRYYRDYGGGLLADILNHWADVAQWMMGDANPRRASVAGGIFHLKDGRENPDSVAAVIEYANWALTFESTVLPVRDERPGVTFFGTGGTLELTRSGYLFTPAKGPAVEVRAEGGLEAAHATDFLDAIAKGRSVSAPPEIGVEGLRPCFLARTAYWKEHSR